jgi:hypothetical protein
MTFPGPAEWGWHGGFPKGTVIGGVVTIILLIAFIPGPYQSRRRTSGSSSSRSASHSRSSGT